MSPSFGPRPIQATASVGACLAGLAVSDGIAVLHGGAGCEIKLHALLHRHDPSGGIHRRFACTKVDESALVLDPGATLGRAVASLAARQQARLAVVTAAAFVEAAGLDHAHIESELAALPLPAIYVVAPDTDGDLFEGYRRALGAIARRFARSAPGPERAGRVNLVGYLLDRPFLEHQANVAEVRRLLAAVGLVLNTVLLDGSPARDLARLPDAELAVVLPGGDLAGDALAAAGQPGVRTGLPMGVDGTAAWLRAVAPGPRAEALIAAESARARDLLRRAAEPLVGRTVGLFADGAKLAGLLAVAADLRLVPRLLGLLDARRGLIDPGAVEVLDDPDLPTVAARLAVAVGELDLVVGPANVVRLARRARIPAVEFGFPCEGYQALTPVPYWGFAGVLGLAERFLAALPAG